MQCPVCEDRMKEVERQGVSIDICPGCKGVWLDRGELEKLIALSQQEPPAVAAPGAAAAFASFLPGVGRAGPTEHDHRRDAGHGDHDRHHGHGHDHDRDRRHEEQDRGHGHSQQRRGSWLGDLFGD